MTAFTVEPAALRTTWFANVEVDISSKAASPAVRPIRPFLQFILLTSPIPISTKTVMLADQISDRQRSSFGSPASRRECKEN
jgi:hypothetical protein